ncbi:MAG: ABC transporter ATP-binding protein [Cyanobacteria bacterium QS_6_48_18]|nr:MAG: ABC transporter ATP-binding protein [Cyanobacteria bacterium QS_3_48_167]PSO93174.1 MAG: ABC transporter ATP-binding protein [Cyanobacteria bacterium QS_6_48_18]
MKRFNLKLFKQFWAIAKPYWFSEEKWGARALLLLIAVLLLGYTGLSVVLNIQRGVLISSLSNQQEERFWRTVLLLVGVILIYAPLFAGYNYWRDKLGLYWRRWLTNSFLDKYFSDRAFYQITANSEIDNPDQRIAEDIKSFTKDSLRFLLIFIGSLLQVVAFSVDLWGISRWLVIFLIIYAFAGTLLTTGIFGRALVRLNFEQLKKEASFRFGLVRVRENAESIAFYRGEPQESNQVKNRFLEAYENFKRLIFWELGLNFFTNSFEFITFLVPAVVIAPSVFSGELEVGKVTEAQGAFFRIFFSLNVIIDRFDQLTEFGAGVDRLATFSEYLESPTAAEEKQDEAPTIEFGEDSRLALENLTLQTPNYQRTLVENLAVEVPAGEGLLIVGTSGCGKSSLLRAIAGLWKSGSGKIVRPPLEEMLFLPQRPYMILGTLRDQLIYPSSDAEVEDEQLKQILQQVNLPNLVERFGGLDAEESWAEVLSLGEQQRVAFARILVNQPRYTILDEATSALDVQNEEYLYQHLQATETTFVSVGHRPTLRNYHQLVLELSENEQWELKQSESIPV